MPVWNIVSTREALGRSLCAGNVNGIIGMTIQMNSGEEPGFYRLGAMLREDWRVCP
jgi:hypothetical protein